MQTRLKRKHYKHVGHERNVTARAFSFRAFSRRSSACVLALSPIGSQSHHDSLPRYLCEVTEWLSKVAAKIRRCEFVL